MRDYSSDIRLVQQLHRFSIGVDAVELGSKPVLAVAKLAGLARLTKALESLEVLDDWALRVNSVAVGMWRLKYGVDSFHRSHAIRSFAKAGEHIGTLGGGHTTLHYYDVFGIPVAREPFETSDVFYSPASPAEIFQRARACGSRWRLSKDGALHVDDAEVYEIRARQTSALIDRIREFEGVCRAVVLWGPPRGGKSVAARQIAEAIAGGWVRVCGSAAASAQVWAAVHDLRPEAIILDDLDTCAHREDDLLAWLEEARSYARVIVSTVNILPGESSSSDHASHELRGAILAPGRAADEAPLLFAQLDDSVRAALAPDVPEHLRAPDLLAAYLVELQTRAEHLDSVTQADVEEMRKRMHAVGDR